MTDQATMQNPEAILRKPYCRLFIEDEVGGGYCAEILEFSGCFAEGDTIEEAADNLQRAAKAWVLATLEQGQQVPEPKGEADYSGKVMLRMPSSLHRQAALLAKREGVSLNRYIIAALGQYTGARTKQ